MSAKGMLEKAAGKAAQGLVPLMESIHAHLEHQLKCQELMLTTEQRIEYLKYREEYAKPVEEYKKEY